MLYIILVLGMFYGIILYLSKTVASIICFNIYLKKECITFENIKEDLTTNLPLDSSRYLV